ncbi:MAG: hypothetical protein GY832_30340 [Chloroflexi bacterium]|nr:hypothetical protein [Chloroflexota bacterium]
MSTTRNLLIGLLALLLISSTPIHTPVSASTNTPTPTPPFTSTPTNTPTNTPTPTSTPTNTPTSTPTPTNTPTSTPTPTDTPTLTPTSTNTPTPTPTSTFTRTPTPTPLPSTPGTATATSTPLPPTATPTVPIPLTCPVCPPVPIFHTGNADGWDLARLPVGDEEAPAVNLTHNSGHDTAPAYSAEGWWVAFQSNMDGNWEIYTVDFFGRHLARQTYGPSRDTNPAWSPKCAGSTPNNAFGTIAFQSDRRGNWDIFLLDLGASTGPSQLTTDPGNDTDPSWAPDGSALVFESDRNGDWNIFTIRPNGTGQTKRTNNPADEIDAAWSPSGSAIAYVSNRSNDWDLYMLNLDNDQELQLTSGKGDDLLPVWSPDGQRIAFQSNWDGDWEIYVYDVISNTLFRLTDNPANDQAPAWNCGGNRVLFHSDQDGDANIYSVALDDPTDVIQLTDQDSTEQDVVWQPVSRDGSLTLEGMPIREQIGAEAIEEQSATATPRFRATTTLIPPTLTEESLTGTIAEIGSNRIIPVVISLLLLIGLVILWLISARKET